MADIKQTFGSVQTMSVTGLGTLANAVSVTSTAIDTVTDGWLDIEATLSVTTGAATVDKSLVEIYVKGSVDATDYDDDANDRLAAIVIMSGTGAQTRKKTLMMIPTFGTLPASLSFRIRNATGDAFTSATLKWRGVKLQSI